MHWNIHSVSEWGGYLDDADWLPGEVEAGVEQEGEDEGEGSVPAHRGPQGAAVRK